ncbi:hypothetical protein CXB51_005734 [Gossypium anomalum]|uniref:Uncharacterized protein n=1 Tax=Gossypium anomalum TaxID=47600 RepID=A0A8J6D854_9ROSI|nr:hypothetical protein CXB51_005734 [Gossypium anomalum]
MSNSPIDTMPFHSSSQSDIDEIENLITASIQSGPTTMPRPVPAAPPPPPPVGNSSSIVATGFGPPSNTLTEPVLDTRRSRKGLERLGSVRAFLLHCFLGSHALLQPNHTLLEYLTSHPFRDGDDPTTFTDLLMHDGAALHFEESEVFAVAFALLAAGAVILTLNVLLLEPNLYDGEQCHTQNDYGLCNIGLEFMGCLSFHEFSCQLE